MLSKWIMLAGGLIICLELKLRSIVNSGILSGLISLIPICEFYILGTNDCDPALRELTTGLCIFWISVVSSLT